MPEKNYCEMMAFKLQCDATKVIFSSCGFFHCTFAKYSFRIAWKITSCEHKNVFSIYGSFWKNWCISTGRIFNLHNLKGNGNKLELGAVFVCLPIWPPSEPPCFIGTLAGISTDKMCVTVRNNIFVDLNSFRDITVLLSNDLTSH